MKPFIKVIEIWGFNTDRSSLELSDSYYGDYDDFNKESMKLSFSYGEGLPGSAWQQSTPIIITDLEHSCFVRKDAAKQANVDCAIALPIFSGQFLLAVVVFLCGHDNEQEQIGALEIWGRNKERSKELHLVDGFYGELKKFEWISRRISFQKGVGFPGTIWDYHIPQIVSDLSNDATSFMRASSAQLEGITTAFGIPFIYDKDNEYVLTLLSARSSPIARRFEIWLPDREHRYLSMYSGHTEIPEDVFSYNEIKKGQGLIGQVWLTGCPKISRKPLQDCFISTKAEQADIKTSVALPIIEDGVLIAVVAFTL